MSVCLSVCLSGQMVSRRDELKGLMRTSKEELESALSKIAGKEIRVVSENMPEF